MKLIKSDKITLMKEESLSNFINVKLGEPSVYDFILLSTLKLWFNKVPCRSWTWRSKANKATGMAASKMIILKYTAIRWWWRKSNWSKPEKGQSVRSHRLKCQYQWVAGPVAIAELVYEPVELQGKMIKSYRLKHQFQVQWLVKLPLMNLFMNL